MSKKKTVFLIIGICIAVTFFLIEPFGDLSEEAVRCLGIFFCAVVLWIGDVFPFFVTCVAMMCAMVMTGSVSFSSGFQGFSSTVFCFMLGAMGMSASLNKCGLLKRMSQKVIKLFPPTFKGQTMGLLLTALVVTPLLPSVSIKVAMLLPLSQNIADSLGYEPRSKGMHGIYSAAFSGVQLGAFAFCISDVFVVVARGLMPEADQARFGFIPWFLYSALWLVIVFVLIGVAINVLYRPDEEKRGKLDGNNEIVIEDMGKMSKQGKIALTILIVSVLLWAFENQIGIPSHMVALSAAMLMLMLNVATVKDFIDGVSWNILLIIGILVSLSSVFGELGINAFAARLVSPIIDLTSGSPVLLIFAMVVIIYAMRFVISSQMASTTIFMSIFLPVCQQVGISPWIVAFLTVSSAGTWTVPYQNTASMQAFATYGGEDNIKYSAIAKTSICYMLIHLIAVAINIPFWKLTGLIP